MNEITLHQPPGRAWNMPNASPFCAKLETYLRITEIPYKLANFARGQAPQGKMPYVTIDGTLVGDSQRIIDELERRLASEGKPALDAGLSPKDAAVARLARRAIEEALYFVMLCVRWQSDSGYALVREEFKKYVPGFIVPLIRRSQIKKAHTQGTGRHPMADVMATGAADYAALAELLGDQPFFLGDQPRTIDCTLYAFLEGTLAFPADSPIKQAVASHANLVAYRTRIRERWWKDLA